ncbi:heparan-alpha-glucosaminide N-acetyltransferase [uncultured Methanocorpusculum sp.]|nr:heparan-alpha-glucosaminide N-acetyltransferase [uncultured Methanocorpusculum sp.]
MGGEVREYDDSILTESGDSQSSKSGRYWEIDAIRGIAILGMLFYHLLACLVLFHIIAEDPNFLSYYNTYMFGSGVFVLLAGIAMILRHERMRGRTTKEYYLALVIKALFLLALGFCITIGSWIGATLFLGSDAFIKFGFLHMLGVSMLLAIPLLRYGRWNIILGLIIIAIGAFIFPYINDPSWLYPLGIHAEDFMQYTQDYFPLFPWFGVLLLGVGLGTVFYPNGRRSFTIREPGKIGEAFAKLGNGAVTLFIYLVHIPVIFVILWIFSSLTGIGYL